MIKFISKVPAGWQVHANITVFNFPGGEIHLTDNTAEGELAVAAFVTGADVTDYIALAEWAELIHSKGQKAVALIPYLPAARADRGHPFGAKVYADLINMANLDQVVCLDPHSPVMPSLVNNLVVLDSDIIIRNHVLGRSGKEGYVGVIAPDAGAVTRAQKVADTLHLPLYKATKHRDFETGKLSHFEAPADLPAEGRLLLVDDICDGGGTFLGLADAIGVGRERLSLWVSHGIFSGRANLLKEKFGAVYTTDSHPGADREDVGANVLPVLPYLLRKITVQN